MHLKFIDLLRCPKTGNRLQLVKEVIENDILREEEIIRMGIKVLRFTNDDIRNKIDKVIEDIKSFIIELKGNTDKNE